MAHDDFEGPRWTRRSTAPNPVKEDRIEESEFAWADPGYPEVATLKGDDLTISRQFDQWGIHMDVANRPATDWAKLFGSSCPLELLRPVEATGRVVSKTLGPADTSEVRSRCGHEGGQAGGHRARLRAWAEGLFGLDRDVLWNYGDYGTVEPVRIRHSSNTDLYHMYRKVGSVHGNQNIALPYFLDLFRIRLSAS